MTDATPAPGPAGGLRALLEARAVVSVVRAPEIPDAAALCDALHRGGIGVVELTFTTPRVEQHLARALRYAASSGDAGVVVGVGTVTRADQARAAIDAGAAFLVTPGIGRAMEEVVRLATAGVPVMLGGP
jgi:2-dehydro-3-deoxyphosphogluconate aldolase/(4S)-4-hydroxy-2-oxoglutarate aldolase